jgi:hypothetical protein
VDAALLGGPAAYAFAALGIQATIAAVRGSTVAIGTLTEATALPDDALGQLARSASTWATAPQAYQFVFTLLLVAPWPAAVAGLRRLADTFREHR